jgi:hypothetical protein
MIKDGIFPAALRRDIDIKGIRGIHKDSKMYAVLRG